MHAPVSFALGLLLAAVMPRAVLAVDATRDPALVAQLRAAATQLDRLNLLPEDSDWTFDFNVRSPLMSKKLFTVLTAIGSELFHLQPGRRCQR